jgi:hypothetical protein
MSGEPFDLEAFVRERDTALRSLDREQILAYLRRYNLAMPTDEWVFWAGVHKAILCLSTATREERQRSLRWLFDHGSAPLQGSATGEEIVDAAYRVPGMEL